MNQMKKVDMKQQKHVNIVAKQIHTFVSRQSCAIILKINVKDYFHVKNVKIELEKMKLKHIYYIIVGLDDFIFKK